MAKNILVTGGAGFIGSNTTKFLCDRGYNVTVFDNLSWGHRHLVDKRAKFIKGDLLNYNAIERAIRKTDVVFHFAATSIINFSIKKPFDCFDNNLRGLINLLQAMRKQRVWRIINSSSASVYGEPKIKLIREDSPKVPRHPYGASKLAAEAILAAYYHAYGINSTSLRYFNAYGPGDEQKPITRAVPTWIQATLAHKPVPLFWKGGQTRDYVFVDDIARAHMAVIDLPGYNCFNVGTGKGVLVKSVLREIFLSIGWKTKIVDMGERLGDPKHLVADISKIRRTVGWVPKIGFKEGIKLTVAYYQSKS